MEDRGGGGEMTDDEFDALMQREGYRLRKQTIETIVAAFVLGVSVGWFLLTVMEVLR